MNKQTVRTGTVIIIFIISLGITILASKKHAPRVVPTDGMKECISQNGRYKLYYNEMTKGYIETCDTVAKELFDRNVNY